MTIIKMSDSLTPDEVLDHVKREQPSSVLVMWIDHTGEPRIAMDGSVSMQHLAYYNKSLDIWTQEIMVNGSY